ncbi:MAG: DMT family transporter [Desulfobacterales bacterium]|nr:DMT family transporter [Desulfobacterales bacterium]
MSESAVNRPMGLQEWSLVLGLATISTAMAYIIYFRVLATAGATNILLVSFLIPVSAIFLGTVFLDEQLAGRHFMGMGLIGVGLAAIDGRLPPPE